ncbi:MAG: lipopolysaccharide heptosyltransferase II [Gammaproteobacteria bacterium]|nr:lipopolysaccharide heptosyltransferase II [Gammaproteobacteria bacterium]
MSKILIVGPSWVGDMVMAQSLFKVLKQQSPNAVIDVLAPAWSLPLLERMPEVNQGIAMPLGHGKLGLGERYRLGKSLRSEQYDQAILLPNSLKSAIVPWAAKIPKRTGFRGEMRYGLLNDLRLLDKQQLTMTVQRFVALADADGAELPEIPEPQLVVVPERIDQALSSIGVQRPEGKLLVLCPGAEYGPAKQWPAEYFAAVAREKMEQGWQVWLLGSEKDQVICDEVISSVPPPPDRGGEGVGVENLAGRTTLEQAIDLMSLAIVVIGNDSGLMHVAAALDRDLVAIYGSSDPNFTPPLNQRAQILGLNLECSPCFKRECPLGHTNCLTQLEPAQVLQAIEAFPVK